ncbi:MAG: D-alanine--D-alanine ligase [Spirochaetes bacterium]|nr:D-alanine--D-alanine ligase [Spirochaetota bacterium]
MIRIGLLYGGMSSEHDVSLCSAASVYEALDKDKYKVTAIGINRDGRWHVQDHAEIVKDKDFGKILNLKKTGKWLINHFNDNHRLVIYNIDNGKKVEVDFILPIIHGTNCEDGRLQGLLELASVPYAGADVTGSAIAMDKDAAKRLLDHSGIRVVPWHTIIHDSFINDPAAIIDKIVSDLSFPLFVKPNAAGSSIGILKVKEKDKLKEAIENALLYDNKVLIEKGIDCFEIECSVLGNNKPESSITGQIIPKHEFYSYEAKYIDPQGAELKIPADIDGSIAESIRKTALDAYSALCCSGMARIDFFLEKGSNKFYLNEINTLPGFTSISMYPKLWEHTGLPYSSLLDRLIELGFEAHQNRIRLKTKP